MPAQSSIVNLSSFPLTKQHYALLSRGLKFCPTPPAPNPGEQREDMDKLHRRVRQISFYDTISTDLNASANTSVRFAPPPTPVDLGDNLMSLTPFKHRKFKIKSTGRGPTGPPTLEAMITSNEQDYNKCPTLIHDKRSNLTPLERSAIKELINNHDIIIKPADKGAAVVVMNREDYLKEGYRQLSDVKFYRVLNEDPTERHRIEVNNMLEDMKQNGEIDETTQLYLSNKACRTSEFYMLPKIHKGQTPCPGRPIISANGSPTEKISQFVDHFLNPPTQKLRSYVRDTTHFLQILETLGHLPPNCILATLDVSSLYTNIPNAEGIEAARTTLNGSRSHPGVKPTNVSLIALLELVLKRNNFQFNGNNYLQVGGTAMGTKLAPGYAINFMGTLEDQFVYTYHLQALVYVRYIDDIFIIWQHGEEELNNFISHLNNCSDHIKFTSETSTRSVAFLDTLVLLQNNHIETDLYSKPTDSHNYLMYDSAHPQRCKDSIPYSQFLRIRRICSQLEAFDRHVICYTVFFLKRNYPIELLEKAAERARSLDRLMLLEPHIGNTTTQDSDAIYLIMTYHPHDNSLKDLIYHNWEILGKSLATEELYHKKLRCGYRRPKNLRDLLVRAKVKRRPEDNVLDPSYRPPSPPPPPAAKATKSQTSVTLKQQKQRNITDFFEAGTSHMTIEEGPRASTSASNLTAYHGKRTSEKERGFPFCGQWGCKFCPLLNKTGTILCTATQITHPCMKKISCRSSNLIYAITCKRCKLQYVGQTLLRLRDRFTGHFGDINNSRQEKSVSRHFSQQGHQGVDDMQISVLEFIKNPPRSPQAVTIRNRVEMNWIHLFRSLAPRGLNMENPKEYIKK